MQELLSLSVTLWNQSFVLIIICSFQLTCRNFTMLVSLLMFLVCCRDGSLSDFQIHYDTYGILKISWYWYIILLFRAIWRKKAQLFG